MEKNSIGIKTLDKIAKEYVPYYDNRDDGTQPRTAHGFSYHNGPVRTNLLFDKNKFDNEFSTV